MNGTPAAAPAVTPAEAALDALDALDGVEPPDWDEEACEEAEATADEIAEHDPEAAQHLYAQLAAVRRARQAADAREQAQVAQPLDSSTTARPDARPDARRRGAAPYDPMRLYAQLAHYYHFSDRDIEGMHFPRVFAYYREAVLMQEEEAAPQRTEMELAKRDARREARRGGSGAATDAEAAALADGLADGLAGARPRTYTGPVARLA